MPVQLSKYCNLDGIQTVHLKIAGEQRGAVHFFLHNGPIELLPWQRQRGETQNLTWQLLHPRDDLAVLVFRTHDMDPENAQRLIQHMFHT